MRKTAAIKQPTGRAKRVMIFDGGEGVYLFLFNSEEDGPCSSDYWFQTVDEAEQSCADDYGITPKDWQVIADPLPGCQHDWIKPTRVKRDSEGKPLYGQFEPFADEPTKV